MCGLDCRKQQTHEPAGKNQIVLRHAVLVRSGGIGKSSCSRDCRVEIGVSTSSLYLKIAEIGGGPSPVVLSESAK